MNSVSIPTFGFELPSLQPASEPEPQYGGRFIPRFFSWAAVAILIYWILSTEGGLPVNLSGAVSYHILGMGLFALLTNQEAVMQSNLSLFQCLHSDTKIRIRFLTQLTGGLLAGAGLAAVYYPSSTTGLSWFQNHLYSPHAWMGVATLASWLTQSVTGLIIRSESHLYSVLCKTTYGLGLATCMLGFQERQTTDLVVFSMSNSSSWTQATSYVPNSWPSIQSSLAAILVAASGIVTYWFL